MVSTLQMCGVDEAAQLYSLEATMRSSAMSRSTLLALLLTALTICEGCQAVEGIFKAGFWVGIVIAVVVVAGIVALVKTVGS